MNGEQVNGGESAAPGEILFEVDGPGVSPGSIDAVSMLEMAASFFAMVAAQASSDGVALQFRGLAVRDKCVAIAAMTDNRTAAEAAARKTRCVIEGTIPAPRGSGGHLKQFRKAALRVVTAGADVHLATITSEGSLPIAVLLEQRQRPMDSYSTLRARPVRIGGDTPAVRFESILEPEAFTLRVTEEQARDLGTQLYREVDVEAILERGRDGLINGGRVLRFFPVDTTTDPWDRWREWFRSVDGRLVREADRDFSEPHAGPRGE